MSLPLPLPEAFEHRMRENLGESAFQEFKMALAGKPITSIRLNPHKLSHSPFPESSAIPWHPYGYFLKNRPEFVFDPLFHAGAYYVQEASSLLVHHFLPKNEPLKVLDLCAAPGGKSTLISQTMAPGSLLVANEVIRSRASILAENMTRWGEPNVYVTQSDPQYFASLGPVFDVVLVDAPCSGEGLFRKDPQSIGHWSEQEVHACAARQKRILADIMPCIKSGGALIYSTCTYSREENENVIQWLLDNFPLELDPAQGLSDFHAVPLAIAGESYAGWRCLPHLFQGEGFFISRLRKKEDENDATPQTSLQRKGKKGKKTKPSKEIQAFLTNYIEEEYWKNCYVRGSYLCYAPVDELSGLLTEKLKVLKGETLLGKIRPKEITPAHELAMSILLRRGLKRVELDKEEALSFLKRQELKLSIEGSGWKLVSYEGVALGWIKIAGGKIKNHYPVNWRIRKS